MPSNLTAWYIGVDFLFLLTGALLLGFALISEKMQTNTPTLSNVAEDILLGECPLRAAIANAVLIFVTFILSLPAMLMPNSRGWLRLHGWLVVVCAIFTLVLGLAIWVDTLQTRSNLSVIWGKESPLVQSLLQQKFNCCGYTNSTTPPFVQDSTCTNSLVAAQKMGCVGPFSSFANQYLDLIFTAAFGIVGVDVLLVLCVVMVIKYREELERYRHIDEKNAYGGL